MEVPDPREVRWAFFPFFPFFGIFLFFFTMRWLWWGCGPGYYRHRPWRDARYDPYIDDRREWEEWHRREHERMSDRGNRSPIT
jgi:hypothetical protein